MSVWLVPAARLLVLGDEEESASVVGCPEGLAGNAFVDSIDDEWLKGLSGSLLWGLEVMTSLLCATLGIALMNTMGRS